MPYDLADCVDGVGIFSGRISPTHFHERAHPEISVTISYEDTSLLASWQTATGRQVTRLIRDGHVSVIPGDQPHGGEWRREAEHLILYLDPGFVSGAARDLLGEDPVEIVENYTAEDPFIGGLASALRAELKTEGGPQRLYLESLANVLSAHLIRNYSAKSGLEYTSVKTIGLSKSILAAVTDYVGDNLARDLTLSELAGVACMSPYHFSRLFKRSTGLSPYQYVIHQRVQRARELLNRTELSVTEVSMAVGFAHQSHLAQHTRRLLGVPPASLRN
jgi:AraC family transcriptional regulator